MMGRDKLMALRKRVKAGEILERDQVLAIIDHGVASWVEMLGGASSVERRRELAAREQQVALALSDVRIELTDTSLGGDVQKAIYMVDAAIAMLKAKGPAWKREWSWYRPRVDEEFGP